MLLRAKQPRVLRERQALLRPESHQLFAIAVQFDEWRGQVRVLKHFHTSAIAAAKCHELIVKAHGVRRLNAHHSTDSKSSAVVRQERVRQQQLQRTIIQLKRGIVQPCAEATHITDDIHRDRVVVVALSTYRIIDGKLRSPLRDDEQIASNAPAHATSCYVSIFPRSYGHITTQLP